MAKPFQSEAINDLKGSRPKASRAAEPERCFQPGRPSMPKTLTGHAKQEWRRLVRELIRRGTSTKLDAGILEIHCLAWQRYHAALAEIGSDLFVDIPVRDATGQVFLKRGPNPALPTLEKAEAVLKSTLTALGATPASRKVSQLTKPVKPAPKPLDEGDAFLASGGVLEFPTPNSAE